MYYVYILRCLRTNEFYKGCTNNIDRRFYEHITGKVKSTRTKLPLRLLHVEICKSLGSARKLECYFKSGAGRGILKELFD